MNNQKNYFKAIFSKIKLKSFGFFLLLAFVFLIFTKLSKQYTETLQLKIELTNVPNDIYINQDSILPFSVTTTTFGFNYVAHSFKNQNIVLDFETFSSKDANRFYSKSSEVNHLITQKLGANTTVESVKPDTLFVPFSKLTSKMIPVKLNAEFDFMPGYNFYDVISVQPDSIKIIGAVEAVANINFIETNLISTKGIKNNINLKADLVVPETSLVKLYPSQVNVTAEVEKYTENIIAVPINFIGLPQGLKINYFPKTAEVLYEVGLKDATRIIPEMFEVVCDYSKINSENSTTLKPFIYKSPNFVRNARLKLTEVEFIITE